jgi:cob(I)alamin adenosyltransferase
MKIYTRNGDQGFTCLLHGKKVSKDDLLTETIGDLDTLNAHLGHLIDLMVHNDQPVSAILANTQSYLFEIGAILSGFEGTKRDWSIPTKELEEEIDRIDALLSPLKNFILPRGHPLVSLTHVTRAICRQAERRLVSVESCKEILPFVNRLSDYLFVLARYIAQSMNIEEVIWKRDNTRV